MKYCVILVAIFILSSTSNLFAEEAYIRNTRWHVRPWKYINRNYKDIDEEEQGLSQTFGDFAGTREGSDEDLYIYGQHETPVNPFVQKILNLIQERQNNQPWINLEDSK